MNRIVSNVGVMLLSAAASGCGSAWYAPPDQYATAPFLWVNNHKVRHNEYDPVVNDKDVVRTKFLEILRDECSDAIANAVSDVKAKRADTDTSMIALTPEPDRKLAAGAKKHKNKKAAEIKKPQVQKSDCPAASSMGPVSYVCWMRQHRSASMCADAIALHAVNQCVAKSGAQNNFSAKANIILGTVLSAGSLAADAAALASRGSNATVAVASASTINSGANNVKTFAPPVVMPKVSDFVSSEHNYVTLARFTDIDLSKLKFSTRTGKLEPADDEAYMTALRYARLHDAVFAACPVGAY